MLIGGFRKDQGDTHYRTLLGGYGLTLINHAFFIKTKFSTNLTNYEIYYFTLQKAWQTSNKKNPFTDEFVIFNTMPVDGSVFDEIELQNYIHYPNGL